MPLPSIFFTPEEDAATEAAIQDQILTILAGDPPSLVPFIDEDTLAIEAVLAAACEIIKDKDARWASWNDLARRGTLVRSDLLLDLRNAVVELKKRGGVL